MSDVTRILLAVEQGDPHAAEQLLPLVYEELRRLAAIKMAQEAPDHTLQATALVHEAYLRLVDVAGVAHWNGRGHFFGAAAEAMRRILVEQARRKESIKAGGKVQRQDPGLSEIASPAGGSDVDLLDLNAALEEFERDHPQKAEIVKLRFFAGLSLEETAAVTGISVATAKRHWAYARTWLFGRLQQK
jgi:RNA polymerase sigma factor (TIGR02999 family)